MFAVPAAHSNAAVLKKVDSRHRLDLVNSLVDKDTPASKTGRAADKQLAYTRHQQFVFVKSNIISSYTVLVIIPPPELSKETLSGGNDSNFNYHGLLKPH